MLKFGDVIFFDSYYFVYLAQKNDNYTYYFAKIISDPETIRQCLVRKEAVRPIPNSQQKQNNYNILTSFIILTTDDFNGQLAFFGQPDGHNPKIVNNPQVGRLNTNDIEKIKKDILDFEGVFPKSLVSAIKAMAE